MSGASERTPILPRSEDGSKDDQGSSGSARFSMLVEQAASVASIFTKEKHYEIDANPTIYSAVIYAPAIARISKGTNWNQTVILLMALNFFNAILQLGLLYAVLTYGFRDSVSEQVVSEYGPDYSRHHLTAYSTFLGVQQKQVAESLPTPWHPQRTPEPPCKIGADGNYHCMPPSVEFASQWNLLDTNGDGVWARSEVAMTAEEAEKLTAGMLSDREVEEKRRLVFFNKIIESLKARAEWLQSINQTLYLSQDILSAKAIPKAYFQYWAGDAMFCTKFTSQQCEHIVGTGFFDDALTRRHLSAARKGIQDYASALRYCNMMLKPGGGCEMSLPSSYKHVIALRERLCGTLILENVGTVSNPLNPFEVMPVTKASFSTIDMQKEATRPLFVCFAIFILYLFYCSLAEEVRDILKTLDFLVYFPSTHGRDDPGGIDRGIEYGEQRYQIDRISPPHRMMVWPVWISRVLILMAIIAYGSWYLLSEEQYFEMVLNAVALSFITGIDEMIYASFIEHGHMKQIGFDQVETMKFQGFFVKYHVLQHLLRKDVLGVLICSAVAMVTVLTYQNNVRLRNVAALSCACMQEGPHCAEAMVNQAGWWQNYWTQVLPQAIHHIEGLHVVRGA